MKITLVHFTDPHWICAGYLNPIVDISQEVSMYRAVREALQKFQDTTLPKHNGDTNILVHTGDSANFYPYHHKVPIHVQFSEVKKELLPILEHAGEGFKYNYKLAVPGNHDVERSLAHGIVESFVNGTISLKKKLPAIPSECECYLETTSPKQLQRQYAIKKLQNDLILLQDEKAELKKGDTFEIFSNDRFRHFGEAFVDWHTPDNSPHLELPVGPKQKILFWLVNSARECGRRQNSAGDVIDAVGVADADIGKWTEVADVENSAYLRIALIHHNPLPNSGSVDSPSKRDVFTNNGPFLQTLANTHVKLVLSGHLHCGDEAFLARPSNLKSQSKDFAVPLIESGFLSVAGPTLTRVVPNDGSPGFNVTEIYMEEKMAEIQLTRYRLKGLDFVPKITKYRVALAPLSSFYQKEDAERRFKVLREAVRSAYDGEEIEPLEQNLGTRELNKPVAELVKAEEKARNYPDQLLGIYAVNVMPPSLWWSNDLPRHFLDSFLYYQSLAHARSRKPNQVIFESSWSVHAARTTAIDNATTIKIGSILRTGGRLDADINHEEWLPEIVEGQCISVQSVSKCATYGLADHRPNKLHATKWRAGNWDIPNRPFTSCEIDQAGIFEIARIMLWTHDELASKYAWRIIELHEKFEIPLFWLDPDRLVNKRGERRKKAGSFLLCTNSQTASGEDAPCYWTNEEGNYFDSSKEGFPRLQGRPSWTKREELWDVDGCPSSISTATDVEWAACEFCSLLRRPDLLFAADAHFLIRSGNLTVLQRFLNSEKIEEDCRKWLLV